MKAKREFLLCIACIVWAIAGINVLKSGVSMNINHLHFLNYILNIILSVYIDFEDRAYYALEKVVTIDLVRNAVNGKIGKFTKNGIMELVPSVEKDPR